MVRFFGLILKWPKTALAVLGILAVLGWRVVETLSVDVFPDISVPRIVIQTEAGGLSADEVERLVTIPIESSVNGLPGVTAIRSSSGGGLSFVWIDFDVGTELSRARFEVFERLSRITETLPEEVRAEIAPVVSVTGEIMLVALTSQGKTSDLELREMAEYDLRMRLLAIPGIGEVTVMGGQLPECRVAVDPERLAAYRLDMNDVIEAAAASYTFASAGYLPSVAGDELPLRQTASLYQLEDLQQALVPAAAPLRLGDVASVSLAGAPRRGSASFEGKDAVLLSIQKTPGGNTLALTQRVESVLDAFAAEVKAVGVEVHREAYRQADLINVSIAGSREVLRDAVIVVVLVLGLTLLHVRTITVVLLTMPLSVLLGVLLFPMLDIGINVMTLGGFAVAAGDIVDASIIFTEVIWRRLRENQGARSVVTVIAEAARSVMPGVLSSTVAIILVFAPLLLLTGLESRFFRPFGVSYLAIFIASFMVAIVAVPTLSKLLWRAPRAGASPTATRESLAARVMKACYRPFVRVAIKVPLLTVFLALAMGVGSGWMAKHFGSSFLPPFREDAFNVILALPPGASLEETERISEACGAALRELPGVLSVTRRTGRAERDQHAEPVSSTEFVVRMDLQCDTVALREAIRETLATVPGTSSQVGYPIAHRISAILSGTDAELAISVFGEDLDTLRATVGRLKTELEATPGVADVLANREVTIKTLRIDYHLGALAEAGLTLQSAGEQVAAAFNGVEVGEMRDGIRRRPITVRLAGFDGADETTVKNLLLHAPGGKFVRLHEVADVVPEEASNLLLRENGRRRALISCNTTEDANIGDLVATLEQRLNPIAQEMGCTLEYGGSHRARENAGKQLVTLGIVLVIVLFAMMLMTLGSSQMALVALISIPLGLMGGVVAVYCTSQVVSVSSLIGFVTVTGFTIRNGILLLNRYQERIAAGATVDEAIIEGSAERMVPILMTSLTTVLGLVPIMMAAHKPGGELLAPLAIVQFGGILGAMFLGLFILPAAARLALRGGGVRQSAVAVLLVGLGLSVGGCQSYSARPIDWEVEAAKWQGAAGEVAIASCEQAALIAVMGNLELNQLRLQAAGSQKVAVETGWWDDPELDLDVSRALKSAEHPFMIGTALTFTIPLSGAPTLEARAAEGYGAADALEVKSAERVVATEARVAYHAYQFALRKQRLLQGFLANKNYQSAMDSVADLVDSGEVPYVTLVDLQQAHAAREVALREATQEVLAAWKALQRVLGLAPNVKGFIVDLPGVCPHCPQVAPEAFALTAHVQVQAQLARLGADELALQAEIRRQYPDLKLGPSLEHEEGMNKAGIVLGVELPLWNRNRQAIAEATATRDVSREAAVATWRTLASEAATVQERLTFLAASQPRLPRQDDEALAQLFAMGELAPVDFVAALAGKLEMHLALLEWKSQYAATAAALNQFQLN